MADVTLKYKGATIGELSESGSKTIETAGKFCEDDILLEYVSKSTGAIIFNDVVTLSQDTITPSFDLGLGATCSDSNLSALFIRGEMPLSSENQAIYGIKQYRTKDGELPNIFETANFAFIVASGTGAATPYNYGETGSQRSSINVRNGIVSCSTVSKVWKAGNYRVFALFKK